jgi:hypothetical protein
MSHSDLTPFQRRVIVALNRCNNKQGSAFHLSILLRMRRGGMLAVTSSCRSLSRKTVPLVLRIPPHDQWTGARWCLSDAGKQLAAELERMDRAAAAPEGGAL